MTIIKLTYPPDQENFPFASIYDLAIDKNYSDTGIYTNKYPTGNIIQSTSESLISAEELKQSLDALVQNFSAEVVIDDETDQ